MDVCPLLNYTKAAEVGMGLHFSGSHACWKEILQLLHQEVIN